MLGEKLKKIRLEKEFSLESLAKKTSLTRSFLSQVEKNKTSPSISSLIKIAAALEVNVGDLFREEKDLEGYIIHEKERESFSIEKDKIKVELLAPRLKKKKFDPMFTRLGVGGDTGLISSSGVFFVVVLQGKIELTIGGKVYILVKGDSIYLDSVQDHRWKNIGKSEVLAFAVTTMPIV